LWLARDALQHNDLAAAEAWDTEALARAGNPAPSDLLMQMSGDLGNSGHLAEIARLVEPCFDVAVHGLQVGNNLIKAHCDLGQIDAARRVVNQLYAQKRPDWQQTLNFWDTELAKADLAKRAQPGPVPLSATVISIQGPLWARDPSPFAVLVPDKRADARRIAIFGSTALFAQEAEEPQQQLSDGPGRLSRAVPLLLAERIHLATDAAGFALIPWVQDQGFALFGRPYEDRDLCGLAGMSERGFDFIVAVVLDATQPLCKLKARLVRTSDARRMAETQVETSPECPGPAVGRLVDSLLELLAAHAGVRAVRAPTWYETPAGDDLSDYLLRVEQQLAVVCRQSDSLQGGGLFGEREILDGILYLCVHQPTNATVRLVLAETLRQMQKVRPEILSEYQDKIRLLQRDHPPAAEVAKLIDKTLAEVLGG